MADIKKSIWENYEHWSQCLRCAICYCCLKDPHTLECGHTFCKKCLKRLASIEKEDNPGVPRRRLLLICPSCRFMFPARPTLKRQTNTNVCLKYILDMWTKECRMLLNSTMTVQLRSIATQTQTIATNQSIAPTKSIPQTQSMPKNLLIEEIIPNVDYKYPVIDLKNNPFLNLSQNPFIKLRLNPKQDDQRNELDFYSTFGKSEIETSCINIPYTFDMTGLPLSPSLGINNSPTVVKSASDTKTSGAISDVEMSEYIRPGKKYIEEMIKRVKEFLDDQDEDDKELKKKLKDSRRKNETLIEAPSQPRANPQLTEVPGSTPTQPNGADTGDGEHSSSSESDVSTSSSNSVSNSDASLSEIFGRITMPRLQLSRDFTVSRLILGVIWCLYSITIVALSDTFLPYISVLTFFSILLLIG